MYYGWAIVAACVIVQSLGIGVIFYGFGPMVVPWSEAFDVSRAAVLLAGTAVLFGQGLLAPLAGKLMMIYPVGRLVPISMAMMGVAFLLVSTAQTYVQFMAIFALVMPVSLVFSSILPAQTLVARWFVRRRGLASAITSLGPILGGIVAPVSMTWIMQETGWRSAYHALAALEFLLLPLIWWVLRRTPTAAELRTEAAGLVDAAINTQERAFESEAWPLWRFYTSRIFLTAALGAFVINGVYVAVQQNLAPHVIDLGLGAAAAAVILSITPFGNIAGKLVIGPLCDRLGERSIYVLIGAGHLLALVLLVTSSAHAALAASALLVGFAVGGSQPLLTTLLARYYGQRDFSRAFGAVLPIMTANAILAPIVAWIRDGRSDYDAAFALLGVLILALMAGVFWTFPARPRAAESA